MVEGGGGNAFPVVLHDGAKDISVGDVRIYPTLDFKTFQMMLSQKIGVSPNQISMYLIRKPNSSSPSSPPDRFKIPITSKSHFSVIARQKDCYVLAVLKRSRKSRKQKVRDGSLALEYASDYSSEISWPSTPLPPSSTPENFLLLRRHQPYFTDLQYIPDLAATYYNQMAQSEIMNLNNRLQSIKVERENHEIAMSRLKSEIDARTALDLNSFPKIEDNYPISKPSPSANCAYCTNANEDSETVPFHLCPRDPVIRFFRTTAGPIGRPQRPPPCHY